jgi:hypothetical protein
MPKIKHTGGGWYELPSGRKVQGKEAAEAAMNEGAPEKAASGGGELVALVNIPARMVGRASRVERGDTFTVDAARAKHLLRVRYAERA